MPCTVAMCSGCRVGFEVAEGFDVVDFGEGLEVFEAHVFEGGVGLFAEGGAVDEEEHAAEAACFDEAVDEAEGEAGLAGAGGEGEEHVSSAIGDGCFDGGDGFALVVAQGEVVGWLGFELGVCVGDVAV
jgi:hypothetical protein